MAIPDYQTLMLPLLRLASDRKEHQLRAVTETLADEFALSSEERNELLPSGSQFVFSNRVGWARTYLKQAGLFDSPRRGFFRIMQRGLGLLQEKPLRIDVNLLERFPEFLEFRTRRREKESASTPALTELGETPEDALAAAYQTLRADLEAELLQQVKESSPAFWLWANFGEVWYHIHADFTCLSFRSVSLQTRRAMTLRSCVLPESRHVQLDAWQIDETAMQITLCVTSTQALVHCPVCRFPTRRIDSRYVRTVADLPWGPWRVVLHPQVRKLFCANGRCTRRIFTERLSPLVAPWARRTQRLMRWLAPIAMALGGRAGIRLSRALGLAVSRHTLLRLLRRLPLPRVATPHGLGVDDGAYRQRQTDGTVLIDLERRRALALLPDREAKTVALWLQAHPGAGVMARDRFRAYADGARQGAPDALQVADRFHPLQNLAETLDQVFNAQRHTLAAVNAALRRAPVAQPDGTVAVPVPPPSPPRIVQELAHQRQARRLALHQQIWAFHHQGWPGWAMAQQLGIGKNTVFPYLRMATLPERKRRVDRGRRILTPYHAYLLERWNAGHRDALRLFREIQRRGYAGSYPTVARYAQRLRQAQGQAQQHRAPRLTLPVVAEPSYRQLTTRRATWLVLRRPARLDEDEAAQLAQLQAQHPEVAAAIALAQDFTRLVRERQPDQLDPWLARAAESPLVPLQRFAKGLRDDDEAVRAGIALPWSTGPVEGHINRLKMLKRQMFGRAKLDLLQQRFLLAA
jgi:transposase